ncbi:Ig-like domain-containing protein [Finegoldia magna]|uniref:Ig-like domain-containing protein n=1 Tax=Finegoldia magna TaxID=1260 RepID=UPI00399B7E16
MNKKNKLNKIIEEKKANSLNKKLRYGLRKLSIGVVSCFLGYAIALTPNLSYANTESNTVVASDQAEKTTKDESKTTQKENKDMLQRKTDSPVGQVDHSDLSTNKITEKSTIQKFSIVNPVEKTEDKVEKMNTQYTVTYGPGLAYVGNSTTVNISFKQNNKKVNVPAGTTFELAGNSVNGATVDKTTGVISYTPDPQEFKNVEKEKNVTVNVKITYKDQSTSTVSATITVRKEESAVPKINPVVEGQTKITGTGVKGANIEVEIEKKVNDGETAGVTTVKEDGTWEVVVEKDSIKEGYKVRAIQTENNKTSTATYTIATAKQENEKDKQKPDAGNQNPQDNGQVTPQEKSETPTVNPVTEGDTTISGTGKAGAKIHVTSPKGLIIGENIEVNNEGKWTLNIPKGIELKKGDIVLVVQQEEGKDISKQVSSVVAEKKVDKQTEQTQAPTLNKINEKSTTISGTGKAGAKIFLKKTNAKTPQGIDLAQNIEVDSQGNWTYTVKAGELQVGDTIFAYQKEENKLISYEAHEEVTKAEVKKPDQDNQDNKKNPDSNQKPQQDPPSDDEKEAREKEEEAKLTIKDAYAGDKTLSGTAAPGYKVSLIIELKNQPGTSINKDATVDEHGNWSANLVDELKEGDKVTVYQTKQFKNGEKTITVKAKQEKPQNPSEDKNKPNPPADDNKDKPNPPAKEDESRKEKTKNPTINPVKEGDKVISGTGVPGAKVSISRTEKDSSKGIILAKDIIVDATGNWSVTIDAKKFKEGDTIFAVQREDGKGYSDQTEVTVAKADKKSQQPENNKQPENNNQDNQEKELSKFPVANEIKAGDAKITGQGVPDATIVVTKQGENGKEVKATVGKDGKWSVDLKEAAKEGDEFIIKQQEKGKKDSIGILKSVPKKPQVKKPETNTPEENKPGNNKKPENNNQKLSNFPVVNEIKAGDTKITGKGVVGAIIYVTKVSKNGDRDAASLSAVVGEDGKWSVDLKEAAKEGDEYIIQQQEKGKKDSPRILKVVQKAGTKPEDKKPEDKKPEDKKPEDKKPEDKKPEDKKPEDKKPADKKPEDKKPEDKKPEDKKPADKKPEDKKPEDKKPEDKKPEDKKPEDKKPEDKKPEAKTPEVKKPEAKKPEAKKPEAKTPEVKKPEAKKPENKTPEVKKPEAKTPEVKKPENKTPEVKKPEAKTPEAKKTKDKANNPQRRNKANNKNNPKRRLPKAGYENEILSLAIAGITTLGGVYLSKKKKNK